MINTISAEESRSEYVRKKESILKLLEEAIIFYTNEQMYDKVNAFQKLSENLKSGEFSIVVVGEFSAGKSTLLNALMQKRILPSFSNETTSTVNYLRHKDKSRNLESGTVYYNDGRTEDIYDTSLETIEKHVSTKGFNVAQNVDHLDLFLDSKFLNDGVTLVDSPGLNGVAEGHKEITEQQIIKSHASIFVFSSDHPGSKTDFEFLYDLQKKVKTIIFVLNKIDDIKEDEGETVESVIDNLKKNYKKQFPEETTIPEIWPVSAYSALAARCQEQMNHNGKSNETEEKRGLLEGESRIVPFENRLIKFLTRGEKARQQLLSPVERVISISKECREIYQGDKEVIENTIDGAELESQIASIEEVVNELEKQISSCKIPIKKNVDTALSEIIEELESQISRQAERRLLEIENFEDLEELNDYIQNFEKNFIQKVYSISLEVEENLRTKIVDIIRIHYSTQADLLEQRLDENNYNISIEVKNHFSMEEHFFEVGLKEMDEKTKLLENELKRLKEEVSSTEEDYFKARSDEKKKDKLELEIQNLEAIKNTIMSQMLPPIEQYTEEVRAKQYSGGILGAIGWLLFGGKNVTHHEVRRDNTENDKAIKLRNQQTTEKEEKINERVSILSQYEDVDSALLELKQIQKMAEVQETTEKLIRHQLENIEKINEKYKKEIRRCKRALRDFCDDISGELLRQVKKELKASVDSYVIAIADTIEANIRKDLCSKQERMEKLKLQIEQSEIKKHEIINQLGEKINNINQLLSDAVDLLTELESDETDLVDTVVI